MDAAQMQKVVHDAVRAAKERKIMVLIDGSEQSEHALEEAIQWSDGPLPVAILLVHCVELLKMTAGMNTHVLQSLSCRALLPTALILRRCRTDDRCVRWWCSDWKFLRRCLSYVMGWRVACCLYRSAGISVDHAAYVDPDSFKRANESLIQSGICTIIKLYASGTRLLMCC